MSRETIEHLNTNVLIGNTDQRGHAWHYRAEEQGDESNHYPGAIPIEDVQRRLFHWEAASCRMAMEVPADFGTMTHLTADGTPVRWAVQQGVQAIPRNDTYHRLGISPTATRSTSTRRGCSATSAPSSTTRCRSPRPGC